MEVVGKHGPEEEEKTGRDGAGRVGMGGLVETRPGLKWKIDVCYSDTSFSAPTCRT